MSEQLSFGQLYNKSIKLLDEKHLGEAVGLLRKLVSVAGNWQLQYDLDDLVSAYTLLLNYMKQGVNDPGRVKQHLSFISKAYDIAEKAAKTVRDKAHTPQPTRELPLILAGLEDWGMNNITSSLKESDMQNHRSLYIELFNWALNSSIWTNDTSQQAEEVMNSAFVSINDKSEFVSGLLISSLFSFDVQKSIFFAKQYCVTDDVRLRIGLLVAFVLPLQKFVSRIYAYPALQDAYKLMSDSEHFRADMTVLQLLLLETLSTHEVNRKLREEIIPEIIKNRGSFNPAKFGIEKIEDLSEINPEWKKLDNSVGQLAKLEMQGADVYYSTFASLKHFSFFNDLANWFYPYDPLHPSVPQQVRSSDKKGIMRLLLDSDTLCDSDKYSFCMLTAQMTEQQLSLLASQLPTGMDVADIKKFDEREGACRNVLRNLFRYFYLYNGVKPSNPFEGDVTLINNPLLAPTFDSFDAVSKIGTFAMEKSYYDIAIIYFSKEERLGKLRADLYQKLGFCQQKKGAYLDALSSYEKAFALDGTSSWTIKHLAQANLIVGNYEEALGYYRLLDSSKDSDGRVAFRCGECLVRLEKYDEAIKEFFKAEYLSPKNKGAKRAIAWCSVLTNDIKQARKYYGKLVSLHDVQPDDLVSAGHAAWLDGDFTEALALYLQAAKNLTMEDFNKKFFADAAILSEHGITPDDILLMADLVASNME